MYMNNVNECDVDELLSGFCVGRLCKGPTAPGLADPPKSPSKTEIRLSFVQILELGVDLVLLGFNHVTCLHQACISFIPHLRQTDTISV